MHHRGLCYRAHMWTRTFPPMTAPTIPGVRTRLTALDAPHSYAAIVRDSTGHEVTRYYGPVREDRYLVAEAGHYTGEEVFAHRMRDIPLTREAGEPVTAIDDLRLTPREVAVANGFDQAAYRLGDGFAAAVEAHGTPGHYYRLKRSGEPAPDDAPSAP